MRLPPRRIRKKQFGFDGNRAYYSAWMEYRKNPTEAACQKIMDIGDALTPDKE